MISRSKAEVLHCLELPFITSTNYSVNSERGTLPTYLSESFPEAIQLLVRNSPVFESTYCNANALNRSHPLRAGHRDDVQDCREAAQATRFPSVANAVLRSQPKKPRSRAYRADRGCLFRLDPHQAKHAGRYRFRY